MPLSKVTYFDNPRSRGEEVRLAFVLSGAKFDDNRLSNEAFAALKPALPFGSLPVLDVPGEGSFAQTNAILRLVGRLHGLYPTDPFDGARQDAVLEAGEELRQRLSATSRIADLAVRKAARQAMATDFIPRWAAGIEALIGKGPFVGGRTNPGVADIKIHILEKALSSATYDDIPSDVLAPFAKLTAAAHGVADHPAVKAWYAPKG